MSIDEIKTQVNTLPIEQQDHLVAYLMHLRHQRDKNIRAEITKKLDDRDPANWITLDALKERWKE